MLEAMAPFTWRNLIVLSFAWLGCCVAVRVRADTANVDAIVVLGHRPPRDRQGVEYETRMRVERGVALWKQKRGGKLLFSGGASSGSIIEAEVMAEYARSLGAPPEALLLETASRDTVQNARLSLALLRRHLPGVSKPRILLVTSDYHSERAAQLFRCAGAEVQTSPVKLDVPLHRRVGQRLRELMVSVSYLFIDECQRARA